MKYEEIDWADLNKYQDSLELPDEVWVDSKVINTDFVCDSKTYQVSSYGRCRHTGKLRGNTDFMHPPKVFRITDNGNGYKKVALNYNSATKNYYLHRLIAEAFLPNIDNKPQVNHKPSGLGKFDNRVEHLEWCTEKHNILDAHKNGQMRNRSKLKSTTQHPDEYISDMYRRYKETGKVGETAREFGVSRTTLSSIVNKRSRVAVTDPIDEEYEIIKEKTDE
jgi:ribosomal protein S14